MEGIMGLLGLNTGEIQGQVEDFVKKFNALLEVEEENNIILWYLCNKLLTKEQLVDLITRTERREVEKGK